MLGADREYTSLVAKKSGLWNNYLSLGINLLFAETGFKAVSEGEIVGCAYLKLRRRAGYVFNVSVRRSFRRRGIGSLLMEHLEGKTRGKGRRWMTLQVDDSNDRARKLYESLGYRAYHPQYFVHTFGDKSEMDGDGDVSVGRLSRNQGRRLFAHYLDIERAEGDAWASSIAGDLSLNPTMVGDFYRCLVQKEEVGCIQSERKSRSLRIKMVLDPSQWGGEVALEAIASTLDVAGDNQSAIEVQLGSSKHHEMLTRLFSENGFMERDVSRFYMLKRID